MVELEGQDEREWTGRRDGYNMILKGPYTPEITLVAKSRLVESEARERILREGLESNRAIADHNMARADKAEAREAVLVEALRKIAELRRDDPAPGYEHTPMIAAECQRIARSALAGVVEAEPGFGRSGREKPNPTKAGGGLVEI